MQKEDMWYSPPRKKLFLFTCITMCLIPCGQAVQCQTNQRQLTINPEGQAFIGIILDVATRGGQTCGPLDGSGVSGYEGVRWATHLINQDKGDIGARLLRDSFVPGVKFGAFVFDGCQTRSRVKTSMEEMFHFLKIQGQCNPVGGKDVLGVVDLTGVASTDPSLSSLIYNFSIPLVPAAFHEVYPPGIRAKALLSMMQEIGWRQVGLMVEFQSDSLNVANVVKSKALEHNICITHTQDFPFSPGLLSTYTQSLRGLLGSPNSPQTVVVIASRESISMFLQVIRSNFQTTRRFTWIFTDFPLEDDLNQLRYLSMALSGTNEGGVWVLSPTPDSLSGFEKRWKSLHDIKQQVTPETTWVTQYFQQRKNCILGLKYKENEVPPDGVPPPCRNLRLKDTEDPLGAAVRARDVLPGIHGIFTIFTALKASWKKRCKSRRGVCEPLQQMTRRELVSEYLVPLEFSHRGPGTRSPSGILGGKRKNDLSGSLDGAVMGLYKIQHIQATNSTAAILVVEASYSSVSNVSRRILQDTRARLPPCVPGVCGECPEKNNPGHDRSQSRRPQSPQNPFEVIDAPTIPSRATVPKNNQFQEDKDAQNSRTQSNIQQLNTRPQPNVLPKNLRPQPNIPASNIRPQSNILQTNQFRDQISKAPQMPIIRETNQFRTSPTPGKMTPPSRPPIQLDIDSFQESRPPPQIANDFKFPSPSKKTPQYSNPPPRASNPITSQNEIPLLTSKKPILTTTRSTAPPFITRKPLRDMRPKPISTNKPREATHKTPNSVRRKPMISIPPLTKVSVTEKSTFVSQLKFTTRLDDLSSFVTESSNYKGTEKSTDLQIASSQPDVHILIPSPHDIYIAGLFPVHVPNRHGTDCGDMVQAEVLQEVEAFLWAVDQINEHQKFLPNSTLGAIVLDTCQSTIRVTNQVTSLVKNSLRGVDIPLENILTFVTSLEPGIAQVIGDMLGSVNVTSINLRGSRGHSPYTLQMSPPANVEAEAVVQILRFLGWKYVSVLVSSTDLESTGGAAAFHEVAKASRICISMEVQVPRLKHNNEDKYFDKLIERLTDKAAEGARGVVTFLTLKDLRRLLRASKKAVTLNRLLKHQIVYIGSSIWGDHEEELREYDSILGGALVLKDGQLDVKDFTAYYRLMNPSKNSRNPWFTEYWNYNIDCKSSNCTQTVSPPVIPYFSTPSTPRAVQAVFSFGAALTELLAHLCEHAGGRMCPNLPMYRKRKVLNEFLRNTEVSRVDKPEEFFQFTENFHGNAPLEVLNLRRKDTPLRPSARPRAIGFEYQSIGKYVNSRLSLSRAVGYYHNNSQARLDLLPSTCLTSCNACKSQETDYLFIESPDKLYILATVDVHKPGLRPLECGPLDGDQGIQSVESFLWALNNINKDPKILPGVQLGAVVFDSCGSKEKMVRDITNFLTDHIPQAIRDKLPSAANVVGLVAGGDGEAVRQVVDVTQPYRVATVAAQASHTALANSVRFPALIRLGPGNDATARAIISLLLYWRWQFFSVVYSDGGTPGDIFKHLIREAKSNKLHIAHTDPIPLKETSPDYMVEIWGRLAEAATQGSRVVILLLDVQHAVPFFATTSRLRLEGLIRQGDFVFIMDKSPLPFLHDQGEALGSLIVQPISGLVPDFVNNFKKLSLLNHTTPYPWFTEFWSRVFNCQGALCYSGPRQDLSKYQFKQSPSVVPFADAVKVLALGLNAWLKEACPGIKNGTCEDLIADKKYREQLFEITRSISTKGVDGSPISFGIDGQNVAANLKIVNYRRVGKTRRGMLQVGVYNDNKGLNLNGTLVATYDAQDFERAMSEVKSQCTEFTECARNNNDFVEGPDGEIFNVAEDVTKVIGEGYGQIYPGHQFGITGLVPLHKQGNTFFSCGEFYSESVFQNLVAVAYALSEINRNNHGVGLGAIFFDFCGRTERAREQLFSFFSGEAPGIYDDMFLTPERIVGSISFDDNAAEAVSSILSSNHIPHFSSPVGGHMLDDRKDSSIVTSIPSRTAELRTFISILKSYKWKFVNIIFDNNINGNFMVENFRKFLREENICIADALGIPNRLSDEYAYEVVETLAEEWKPRIVILLVDDSDNIRTIIKAAKKLELSEHFVFLAGDAWGNKPFVTKNLDRISAGALTFTMETYDIPDYRFFLANLTLKSHDPIPKDWFEEYFQVKFQCRLSSSKNIQRQFAKECNGNEVIHPDDIVQDPYVYHTILSINAIAHGLDSYIRTHCDQAETIEECKIVQAELLLEIMRHSEDTLNNTNKAGSFDQGGAYGYHIWNYRRLGKEYGYVNVGKWENSKMKLEKTNIEFKIGTYAPDSYCDSGACLDICSSQSLVYAAMGLPTPLPIDYNFRNIYGIVTSSLSLLGILFILITIVYFMMAFPTAAGTSVLGYIILVGCLMIYSVNFAFIFQPTIGTCIVRRIMMGVGYAIIYSGMLVKVIHSWRLATYGGENSEWFARPGVLVVVSMFLIMVQVILGTAWLILYPTQVDLQGDMWRCTPTENFESELIISFVYVMILIAATIIFSLETFNQENGSRETRWILLASLCCVIAWLVWTPVATQGPYHFRDPAIVIGNLVCATCVLLFIYARRLYMQTHLEVEMRSHYTNASSVYPSLSHTKGDTPLSRTPTTINPLSSNSSSRQYIDRDRDQQEVSFRTVTLPPETPTSRASISSRRSRSSRSPSKRSSRLSLSDNLPEDLTFDIFESSEEEYAIDAHHPGSDEDDASDIGAIAGTEPITRTTARRSLDLSTRQPSIRRVGSRQMLVFLTDGNSIGEVSRI